ncbi:MAG: NADPH:quinone reductase [Gaiellaceae bacterium]|nr:NADPH:quinone reductase [Gaiellaceae bacterium]
MRCVVFTGVGGGEVVDLQERPDPVLGSGELLVRVRYAGLNPADLHQRAGHYPAPPGAPQDIPGLEVAGVVESVGNQVLSYRPGDRVFGLIAGGGLANRVAVHERCVTRVPESLSDLEAAAVPEAFITAHDAIRTRGRLAMGETLLVHGANGGVGTAGVQIGVAAGARVVGVVRSEESAALVRELGAEPVADESFADEVRADVILELVGAPHFPANLTALNPRGRIVVVGVGAGSKVELDLGAMMGRRAELHGTVLRARSLEDKALAVRAFEREVVPQFEWGRMRPLIDRVYPAERARDAYDRLAGSGKSGKVLIDFGEES